MPHSFGCNLQHIVFGTKERRPFLTPATIRPMFSYMGGVARKNGMSALAIGGIEDHAHLLLVLPATMPVAKAVQLIKAGSSKWFREKHGPRFGWQEGYAHFSVSKSNEEKVAKYIRNQEHHHRRRDFASELKELFSKHGVAYDAGVFV